MLILPRDFLKNTFLEFEPLVLWDPLYLMHVKSNFEKSIQQD
jgi:hypothetical protein